MPGLMRPQAIALSPRYRYGCLPQPSNIFQSENPLTLLEIAEEERQTRAGETRGSETEHLRHLEVWIEEQIRVRAKGEAVKPKKSSEVIEERHTGRYTYRLECVRCGKESCRCMDGTGHGPYSYAY